jgi:hypothetical protein
MPNARCLHSLSPSLGRSHSLYAWFEQIGETNFVGKAPDSWKPTGFKPDLYRKFVGPLPAFISEDLYSYYDKHPERLGAFEHWLDPVQATPLREQFDLYADWKMEHDYYASHPEELPEDAGDQFERFAVEVSLDKDLKFDASGLGGYEIAVPNWAMDGLLMNEWHHTTFVEYLRICLRWADLPGLEMFNNPPQKLEDLTQGLLPF